jgi:hypothetical protein
LERTNQMAWENRLALDIMLAQMGRVWIIIGVLYCTYIPDNTALDETISKAL